MTRVASVMSNVFGTFTMRERFELAAIWLKVNLKFPDGRHTVKIQPGDEVVLVNGDLVDAPIRCQPTHKIIGCYGTLANDDFQIMCTDLQTNEPITVQL